MTIESIINAPWAILPEKLLEIRSIYESRIREGKIDIEKLNADTGLPFNNETKALSIQNGNAVIELNGVIGKKMNLFKSISGGVSTEIVKKQIQVAIASDEVKHIILKIDSGGGSVDGVQELAQFIYDNRDKKKFVTLVDGLMASAGYWIGSASHEVYLTSKTATVGSIGVVAIHSYRKQEDAETVDTEIVAGKFKRIDSTLKPLSEEGKSYIQARVNDLYSLFVSDVAKFRNVEESFVLENMADGKLFIGQKAIDNQLVDGILTLDDLINADTSAFSDNSDNLTFNTNGGQMPKTQETAQSEDLQALINSQKEEIKKLQAQATEHKFEQAKSEILSEYEVDVKEGRLQPALRDKIESELNAQKATFSEGQTLAISPKLVKEIIQSSKTIETSSVPSEQVDFAEANQTSADEALGEKIREVMFEHNCDFHQAQDKVIANFPNLLENYKKFTIDVSEGRL